jgi:hypothetical protein
VAYLVRDSAIRSRNRKRPEHLRNNANKQNEKRKSLKMNGRFDTDKYDSGYIPHYLERVKASRRVLEVGISNGGSLLLWCDLWKSVERVIGVDIQPPLKDCIPGSPSFRRTRRTPRRSAGLLLHMVRSI